MSGSFTGQELMRGLLNGTLDSATLETLLTTDAAYRGPYRLLLKSHDFNALLVSATAWASLAGSAAAFELLLEHGGEFVAASDVATTAISNNSQAILTVVSEPDYLDFWQTVPANRARMQARINATGSKLVRYVLSAGAGTWNLPAGGLLGSSGFAIGGGGSTRDSQDGSGNYSISGGSGAGATYGPITAPTSNTAYAVAAAAVPGVAASATTFGALLVAAAGGSQTAATSNTAVATPSAAGGTNSGAAAPYDLDFENAIWQPTAGSRQGGAAGAGSSSASVGSGLSGSAGLSGSGGGGGGATNPANPGSAGTGLCSGGGGGTKNINSNNNTTPASGTLSAAATDYGSGAGGQSVGTGSGTATGGTGAPGRLVIHGVLAT